VRRPLRSALGFVLAAFIASVLCADFAPAQETANVTPPHGWLRQPVDDAHAQLAPHARTIGKWTPVRLPAGDPTALYFAVGDAKGASLNVYAKKVVAALPAGAKNVNVTDSTGCQGAPTRRAAYDLPSSGVHVEEAVAVGETAAALAAYVRPASAPADPLALSALATLCPQSE
jgi:hypothetical protein